MALKEKFLILWILAVMLISFLASHVLDCVVAGLQSACAFGFGLALLAKFAAVILGCWHS